MSVQLLRKYCGVLYYHFDLFVHLSIHFLLRVEVEIEEFRAIVDVIFQLQRNVFSTFNSHVEFQLVLKIPLGIVILRQSWLSIYQFSIDKFLASSRGFCWPKQVDKIYVIEASIPISERSPVFIVFRVILAKLKIYRVCKSNFSFVNIKSAFWFPRVCIYNLTKRK